MSIIYKSFFKKKATRIYLWIFISLGIIFSFLFIAKNYLIVIGNKSYTNSYLYFASNDDIDLTKEKNIKDYNQAFELECNNPLTKVFVIKDKSILDHDYEDYNECTISGYTVGYSYLNRVNIIKNEQLFDYLNTEDKEYYYLVLLKNWFKKDETVKILNEKYHTEIGMDVNKIDSMNYDNVVFLFEIFIKIILLLFLVLFIISVGNIIIDEKKRNILYYSLGYSKLKILQITMNKILLILIIPLFILFLSFIVEFFI